MTVSARPTPGKAKTAATTNPPTIFRKIALFNMFLTFPPGTPVLFAKATFPNLFEVAEFRYVQCV